MRAESAVGEKKKGKKKLRWTKLLLILAVCFFLVQLYGTIDRYLTLEDEIGYYQEQLAQAEAAYEERLATIELLDDEAYIERLARENLGMVKQGETVVSAVRTGEAQDTQDAAAD